nr:hypothetical protein CFP56_55953 [Quercus suber]
MPEVSSSDPRALLQAERINRRITHPQASYTKDGKLLCNLCELPVKNENAWKTHLHSTGHTLRLNRAHDVEALRKTGGEHVGAKKRKADSLDSPAREDRKKVRSANEEEVAVKPVQVPDILERASSKAIEPALAASVGGLDQEYAAFEREMAVLDSTSSIPSALDAAATISAAPMSVADIAAQAREQQSAQRGKRDVEIEGETEDAARLMADELDEMDSLEERVKRLRERRDALRRSEGINNLDGKPQNAMDAEKETLRQADPDDNKEDNDNNDDHDGDALPASQSEDSCTTVPASVIDMAGHINVGAAMASILDMMDALGLVDSCLADQPRRSPDRSD